MKKLAISLAIFSLLLSGSSLAQTSWINPYTGGVWNNPGSCLIDTMIRNRMNQQMLEKSIGRRAQSSPISTPSAPRAQRLGYRPAANLGCAENLAASLTDNPKDRQELTRSFLEGLETYNQAAARAGRSNDLGYALAFYLACSYSAANGCDVPDDRLLGLANQMDQALQDMPGLRSASDAQRQTVAESLVMVGMFIAAGYEQSANQAQARAVFVELAQSSFRQLTGLDPGNVTLTPGGMRLRGR